MSRSFGVICLAVFLILFGLLTVTNIQVYAANGIKGVLAIAAGVLLLVGK
jgi:hypothetical protein